MSKSLSHIFLPAIGGTALAAALALTVANRQYGNDTIASLEGRVAEVQSNATAASEAARAEAERAAALAAEIEAVQAAAAARAALGVDLTAPAPAADGRLGLGRPAHVEEIAAWDVDVLPDGRGLPEGSGDAYWGEEVYAEKCASCHGDFAEGVGNWPVLAGGFDTLGDKDPVKTVGSYWPYLSTVWDYIHRSMPFGEAGTLTADETYGIVAYLLYSNNLVEDDFVLSHENFAEFEMYNAEGFIIDDRPELEYAQWRAEPCMANCKEEVEVTMRSVFLVATPEAGGSESKMNPATVEGLPTFSASGPSFIPEAAPKTEEASAEPAVQVAAVAADTGADLVDAGRQVFRKCQSCHDVGDGARNKSGPHLNDLFGRPFGGLEDFGYSRVFMTALEEGRVWDEVSLAEFLAQPRDYMKGTKMAFSGLKTSEDLAAITAYLKTYGD